jgi:hypothetical protein
VIDQPELTDEAIERCRIDKPEVKNRPCWTQKQLDLLSDISSTAKQLSAFALQYRDKVESASPSGRKRGNAFYDPSILVRLRVKVEQNAAAQNALIYRLGRASAYCESQDIIDRVGDRSILGK